MQSPQITLHGFVTGRVQGVFFRAETRKMAIKLGLQGWVRNTLDGRVEILIYGSETAIANMQQWLAKGPPMAKVESLNLQPVESSQLSGFSIRV